MSLTFIDFFAGIGGGRKGMEFAGHKCVGFCEISPYAVAAYTNMYLTTDEQKEYILSLPKKDRIKELQKDEYRNGEWFANDITKLNGGAYQESIVGCTDRPVRRLAWPQTPTESGKDLTEYPESLWKFLDSSGKKKKTISPNGYSVRMSTGNSLPTEDLTTYTYYLKWMRSGMMLSGVCSTVQPLESPNTETGYSLSDILEAEVDQKYFLSESQLQKIIWQ